jgi:predicted transcriptional regulator
VSRPGASEPLPAHVRRLLDEIRLLLAEHRDRVVFSNDALRRGRPVPAVPVDRSVHRNFLVCLETGTRLAMLTRHLQVRLRMTPEEYRRKWGLPPDYPMIASEYVRRRDLAEGRAGQAETRHPEE